MNVLKPFLNPKKLRKLENNPQAFFKDALDKRIIPIQNQLKSLKPKKKHAFAEYYIVSAVYNVEKYLDDYFNSILKQRLDFKNNIKIICVDDGSTDRSAKIIQNYQKRFPENIVYLHKENGGQASARNLGLQWLQEKLGYLEGVNAEPATASLRGASETSNEAIHNQAKSPFDNGNTTSETLDYRLPHHNDKMVGDSTSHNDEVGNKPLWVTFTDPDDFLDRDYFYEVDKFLEENQEKDICMVVCNFIFYNDSKNAFSDTHPLRFRFISNDIVSNQHLNKNIVIFTNSAFFMVDKIFQKNLIFDESLKYSEDVLFTNTYLLENLTHKTKFLKQAKYFYRRRENSVMYFANKLPNFYNNYKINLLLFKKNDGEKISFLENLFLYQFFWYLNRTINNETNILLTEEQKCSCWELLKHIFSYIDILTILEFNLINCCWFYHKVGILNCFKNEYPPFQITYIKGFDIKKEQILIQYFTPDDKDIESIRLDGKEVYADYEKIVQNNFLDRVFCYEKRLWVHIPTNANKLEIFIRGQRAKISFKGKQYQYLTMNLIDDEFYKLKQLSSQKSLWFLMDRSIEADDSAETLYRYISKIYPKENIVFALKKASKDWDRLKHEGFNLVELHSNICQQSIEMAKYFISSHNPSLSGISLSKGTKYIFLQHGVSSADISQWFNDLKFDLIFCSSRKEYDEIVGNGKYQYTKKESVLSGLARHDTLLINNQTCNKQILIMPTWRYYLAKERLDVLVILDNNFLQSQYFIYWNSLLHSKQLKQLVEAYHYSVLFCPHFNMIKMLDYFEIPEYIEVRYRKNNESFQKILQTTDLLITDYSSVAFEMAYLKKPVLYYQFDKEEFFANHSYRKGYFDYYTDGFGPVVTTEEYLLKELEILLKNDCKVGEPYKSNIENTFEFRDGKCCERIYQAILELDKPYERKWTLDDVLNLANNALEHQCYKEASERFRFVLEHLGESEFSDTQVILNEEIIFNYLYASRLNQTSQEALEFIKAQEYESKLAFSNKVKFEIIKNYIEILDAREVIARLEDLRDAIPQEELLEFAYLKLRIYAYLGDKQKLKEVYNELKNTYNIDKKDLDLDLFLFQNELIKAASLQTASTSAGGGPCFISY